MASSRHSAMQCSSLPQASGRGRIAIPSAISRHLTPHTSTQRLQPVHLLASMMGTHLAFMVGASLVEFCIRSLLDDDRAFHPWVRCALEMHHTLLIKLFGGKRLSRSEHRRSKLALLAEHAV